MLKEIVFDSGVMDLLSKLTCHFKFFFGSLTLISCSFSAPLAEKIHSISFESPNHVPIISCVVGTVVPLLRHLILHQGTHYNRGAFRTVYRKKEKNKANLSNSSVFFNKRVGRTFFTKCGLLQVKFSLSSYLL